MFPRSRGRLNASGIIHPTMRTDAASIDDELARLPSHDEVLTIAEASGLIGISRRTFYRISALRVRVYYTGVNDTSPRISRGDVLLYIALRQGAKRRRTEPS
jgi:hypothetical protein